MFKAVIFDVGGMTIKMDKYFSQLFSEKYSLPLDDMLKFFNNEFQQCLIGKADLKKELKKYLKNWGWKKSLNEFLNYWFKNESIKNKKMIASIIKLRKAGIKCYLATDNEKYKLKYLLNKKKLKNIVDEVFTSVNFGCLKKQQKFWQLVYKSLNQTTKIKKQEILVWDDSLRNVLAAKQFGLQTELYKDFGSYKKKMPRYFVKLI